MEVKNPFSRIPSSNSDFFSFSVRTLGLSHAIFQLNAFQKYWNEIVETKISLGEVQKLIYYENGKTDTLFNVKKFKALIEEIKEKLRKDKDYFNRIVNKIGSILKESEEIAINNKKYIERLEKGDQNTILGTFLDYWEKMYRLTVVSWLFDIFGDALIEKLIENLIAEEKYREEDIREILSKDIFTIFLKEKLEFFQLAEKIVESQNYKENLKEHHNAWAFIGMENPIATPFTLDYFKKRLVDLLKKSIIDERNNFEVKLNQEKIEFNSILERLKPKKETFESIEQVRKFVKYKNNDRILLQKYVYKTFPIFYKVFEICEIPSEYAAFVFDDEIISTLKKEISTERLIEIANQRKNKRYAVYLLDFVTKLEELKLTDEPVERKKILKGFIASKGYIKGRAKIIIDPIKDANKLEKGDILITTMTTPDFVPLFEKVSAIVTDEGGILSHAAIVSREFGIPCIVGVENASKIIRDNELVEVNAEGSEGQIRILN